MTCCLHWPLFTASKYDKLLQKGKVVLKNEILIQTRKKSWAKNRRNVKVWCQQEQMWALYWETNTCFFCFMKLNLESETQKCRRWKFEGENVSIRLGIKQSHNWSGQMKIWKYKLQTYKKWKCERGKMCSRKRKCDVGPQREQMWVKRELRLGIKHPLNWSCQMKVWKWEWKWKKVKAWKSK